MTNPSTAPVQSMHNTGGGNALGESQDSPALRDIRAAFERGDFARVKAELRAHAPSSPLDSAFDELSAATKFDPMLLVVGASMGLIWLCVWMAVQP